MLQKFFRHGQVQDDSASIQEAAFEDAQASAVAEDHQPDGGEHSGGPVLASPADDQQLVERDSLYMSLSPSAPLAPERPCEDAAEEASGEAASGSSPEDLSAAAEILPDETLTARPRLMPLRRGNAPKGKRLVAPDAPSPRLEITPQQRLLLLDTWRRSGLPAGDFASLVGVSKHTLYAWKKRFEEQGPAGLADQPRGGKPGSRLPDLTRRTILMLKQSHPDWGCQRISDMLGRGPALPACPSAVARVLREEGYETAEEPTQPHPPQARRFERARPNQLWQTDLFTFVLKRQNRRVYLVAFLDDHSRFIVSYGLHASQSAALVLEVFEVGLSSYGPPEEILTDNGAQYITWRGKGQFTRRLEQRGIRQIVARPRHPQTLGKIERFWGTLWRECVELAVFVDLADARRRIGFFIDHYNFQRPHQGIEGLVPADRFFHAAPDVRKMLQARVSSSALELARNGLRPRPFYLTGQLEGKPFSVHREGERLILTREGEERQEIEWADTDVTQRIDMSPGGDADSTPIAMEALPEPICPDGSPPVAAGEPAMAPPMAPGQSVLDADDWTSLLSGAEPDTQDGKVTQEPDEDQTDSSRADLEMPSDLEGGAA
jgi:transposase InsO family protein